MANAESDMSKRGGELIRLLNDKNKLQRSCDDILANLHIGTQDWTFTDGTRRNTCTFIPFPENLKKAFPGTYVQPAEFVRELGFEGGDITEKAHLLTGQEKAADGQPIFKYESTDARFKLAVSNGATNEDALAISQIAKDHGYAFTDDQSRIQYQTHLLTGAQTAIEVLEPGQYGIILHDDCLASADTTLGYLLRRLKDADTDKLRKGVKILIDGPATAQALLLLERFSEIYKIPMDISVNFMAFGLSSGDEKGQHANYITYPQEFIDSFTDSEIRGKLNGLKSEDGTDPQVVSDMGNAGAKIKTDDIENEKLKQLNDKRISLDDLKNQFGSDSTSPDYVIFPRGGEWSGAAFLAVRPDLKDDVNLVILRANRFGSPDDGYGLMLEEPEV